LVAALGAAPARDVEAPIGMGAVEVAVGGDHLRLEPEAEFHSLGVDLAGQVGEAVGELFGVGDPVAERGAVVVAMAEPAVVEDEELDARFLGIAGELLELGGGEVEVGGLPVVDEDGALAVAPRATAEAGPVEGVVGLGHAVEAVAREDEDDFGGVEGGAGGEFPGEFEGVDAELEAGGLELIDFGLGEEVAAVDEAEAARLAGGFGGGPVDQGDEGMLLVAAGAAAALDALGAGGQRAADQAALLGPAAGELDQLALGLGEIEAGAEDALQAAGFRAAVADGDGADYGVPLFVDGVAEGDFEAADGVAEIDLEGGGLGGALDVGGGEAGKFGLSLHDAVGPVGEIDDAAAVGEDDFERGRAVVAPAEGGVFEEEGVEAVGAVLRIGIGAEGAVA